MDIPTNSDFYVGWGTLTLINAGLAQSKGRDGGAWWLASLFLGPLATLLIVITPGLPPDQRKPMGSGRDA